MAAQWYWERDGKEHGPVTTGQLKQMAVQSQLLPSDIVWRNDSPKRVVASKVKGLFDAISSPTTPASPPPLPPQAPILQSVPDSTNGPPASPVPKPVEANPFAAIPTLKESLLESAKAAGQLTAKQAERVKLTNTTLPKLYLALGKHALSTPMYRDQFPEQSKELDKVKADLAQTAIHKDAKDNTFIEKAKATAGNALQTAQAAKLSMRQSSLLANLGKAIYERNQNEAGPEQLVKPIQEALSRVATIDGEIDTLSQVGRGSWITPKRLLISTVVAASLMLWLGSGSFGRNKPAMKSHDSLDKPNVSQTTPSDTKVPTKPDNEEPQKERKLVVLDDKLFRKLEAESKAKSRDGVSTKHETFDLSKIDYSPIGFSTLDYSKGPNREILEVFYDSTSTFAGYIPENPPTSDELAWRGMRQPALRKAVANKSFVFHGVQITWSKTQEVPKESVEKRAKQRGEQAPSYDIKDSVPSKVCYFWNGQKHGPEREYWANGQIKIETSWQQSKQHGKYTAWHENGQKSETSTWVDDKPEGVCTTFYRNGQKQWETVFANGKIVGKAKEWDEKGNDISVLLANATVKGRGFTERVLSLKPELLVHLKCVSRPPGAKPLYPPKSIADFVQSVTLLNGEIRCSNEKAQGAVSHYAHLGDFMIHWEFAVPIPRKIWEDIYGEPQNVTTQQEVVFSDHYRNADHWTMKCTDGKLVLRGAYLDKTLQEGGSQKDKVIVQHIHFSGFIPALCPQPNQLFKKTTIDYK